MGRDNRVEISRRRLLEGVGTGLAAGALVGGTGNAAADGRDGAAPPERHNVGVLPGEEDAGVPAVEKAADSVRRTIDFGELGTVINGKFSEQARTALANNPRVEYVEPDFTDYELHAETTPWGIERIGADQRYTLDTEGAANEATVAVLDTGIDSDHPDLQDNNITGKAFGVECGEDQGKDCCPDKDKTCSGYNGNECHEKWDDDVDHGTHVAGTIAADDDDEDVIGITPEVDLLAGKVFDGCGNTSASDIATAIEWATNSGADVINMSFGGGGNRTEMKACQYAYNFNVVLVAASGNGGFCRDCVDAPARYSTVIGVSNLNLVESLRSDTSTGPEVELVAPGTGILSTVPPESVSDGTKSKGGTSMAAPHVAGTAALVKDITTLSDNEEIRARLRESAEIIDLDPDDQGYGLVDADQATYNVGGDGDVQFTPYVDTLELTHEWETFLFDGEFSDPVVVAGPATTNGWAPTTVRVRNVDNFSAEIRLQEWLYQNGQHLTEEVTVAVFERGHLMELNGVRAETGHVTGVDENWQTVSLQDPYTDGTTPIIIPQCVTFNGSHPVTVRVKNVDENSFDVRLQEEEAQGPHTTEQVDYLAVRPHTILESGLNSIAARTGNEVDHTGTSVSFGVGIDNRPNLLAQMQTADGGDTCNLRVDNWNADGFDVHVDEETSADNETWHTTENVGYVALEDFDNESTTYDTGTGTTGQPDRDTWHPVRGTELYDDPVVVMGPPTENGGQPVHPRVRNVGKTPSGRATFEFQLEEWKTDNGPHIEEKISYGIFEAGAGTIGSATVDVGYVTDVRTNWKVVEFTDDEMFDEPPIVITQCTTQSGSDPVTVRTRNVDTASFQVKLQEEEAEGDHFTERIDWVAIERGDFSGLEASDTGNIVTDTPLIVDPAYDGFSDPPDLLASMQTTDGWNTAHTRFSDWDASGFGVFIEEEDSADSETAHTDENVGYAAFSHDEPGQIDREAATLTQNQDDEFSWYDVSTNFYSFPIVVMGPPTFNGSQPTTVRTRDVTNENFEFQFDEWDYQNAIHVEEDVSYAVFEAGRGTLDANGNAVAEAGAVAAREKWEQVRFSYETDFSETPVVCAQVGGKGNDATVVRVRNVSTEGFEVRVQEQEGKDINPDDVHTRERIDWIAAEPIDTSGLTVARTGNVVDHNGTSVSLSGFNSRPHLLATMQTFDGGDPCNLRVDNWDASGFDVFVDEETSEDGETWHTDENVGYMAFE